MERWRCCLIPKARKSNRMTLTPLPIPGNVVCYIILNRMGDVVDGELRECLNILKYEIESIIEHKEENTHDVVNN